MNAKGLPGSTTTTAVGLDPTSNWTIDATTNKSDITNAGGNTYPICALTWDFVYTHLNNGSVSNPIAGLTADQRRTLYSFYVYALSPVAQDRLVNTGYDPLPATWLKTLRQGFQINY
jgi:hypothetical protein